jgi:O-antigen/teichoic acid export membrane protein
MSRLLNLQQRVLRSPLLINSAWGIVANLLQTGLTSAFFVILARKFPASDFAQFLIANTVYQLVAAFSSMGLSQWFIRDYASSEDKTTLTVEYLKIQAILGLVFYAINVAAAFTLYPDGNIRLLSIILGTNIIFDNLINAIKSLNIAEFLQKKSANILLIDALLKLTVGSLLFVYALPITAIAVLLVVARLITVNLFIKIGSASNVTLAEVLRRNISLGHLRNVLTNNWYFVIIGSVSVVYWSVANIIISKMLSLKDVADYEISFKIFSIMILLPIVASGSIFPRFITLCKAGQLNELRRLFNNIQRIYVLTSVLIYAFIVSFSQFWLPFVFGRVYVDAVPCVNLMFLTFLFFPTVLLQANLIVAMKMEKMDMLFNLGSLVCNVGGCLIGLTFYRSLTVVNYSIAGSFLVFHLLQDVLLIRKGISTWLATAGFYFGIAAFVLLYQFALRHTMPWVPFVIVSLGVGLVMLSALAKSRLLHSANPSLAKA